MPKTILFLLYICCVPSIGICQFSQDFCKFLTSKSDSITEKEGLSANLEFNVYSRQCAKRSTFYAATSGSTDAFYIKRYNGFDLPDFVPLEYVWLPLINDISGTFKKGIIGGILENNSVQQVKLDPQFAFPLKFSFQLNYNSVSLLRMDLTEDSSLK